ncbi:MAG: hypothetical protein EOM80_06000 [Erysipelotrichia bacterium]|nr:hypothetical protein [Candidatus Riflebacteria bacterium]NCB38307.1 hypothetical protein [Erysipelotrichia bacterium]
MKKTISIFCLFVVLLFPSFAGAQAVTFDLQRGLETAFWKAFSEPEEFKACEIFQLLGYNTAEISMIGKITPRPSKIIVEAEACEIPADFRNIKVICTNVLYYNLTIERVVFDFPDCRIDLDELKNGRLRFLAGDRINVKTEVSQRDILKVFDLFAKASALSRLRLKLDDEVASLKGRVKKGVFVVEFNLKGSTQLVDPKKVVFRCDRLLLNGSPMPRNAVNSIFSRINPVFDATKTWLNLNIASINIKSGFVETIATIERKKG